MFLHVKICVLAHVGKSFAKCLFVSIKHSEDPSQKNEISRLYLTQIIHSNGKILFP